MSNTDNTPPAEDNLLGLSDASAINQAEAKGILHAELFLLGLDENEELSASLILSIHKTAFGQLYDWAGKWRNKEVAVGSFIPPPPSAVPNLMYQLLDEINYKMPLLSDKEQLVELLAFVHHRFVFIHPFNNGNGRTARLFTNLLAMLNGYKPLQLYHREGEDRKKYIEAIREGDRNNLENLKQLIFSELETF